LAAIELAIDPLPRMDTDGRELTKVLDGKERMWGEKSIQYGILKREVDSTRQLYDAMLQRLKEASIAAAMRASNIRVVDTARAPLSPYKPDATRNSALGVLAGLFLGVALVVMRERADRSIQEPGDSTFYLNLPELGVIPSAQAARHRLYYLRRKQIGEPAAPAETGLVKSDGPDRVELASWQHKPSLVAESVRAILTSILFSGDNGNRPRVLVVTSGSPKEGKTTVVSNLAIALAEVHQRVLLIDGDMRRPRLHEIFGVGNERGLSDILKENVALAESGVAGAIQETKLANLFLLPSGPASNSASTLLFSRQMPGLLKDLQRQFDSILIDTPPMLQMPDARVLGRLADAVLLVIRAGHTTRDAAMAARQRFEEDGTPVLGTILNDWDPKSSGGSYYGYYKYYGHG
jgi:succinoglycan biosynthesis transport protein ExoP